MKRRCTLLAALLACSFGYAVAQDQRPRDPSRGELLYSIHCIACHNTSMHWRDKSVVTNWPTLVAQVSRWQRLSGQAWDEKDVTEVARYLNALHYHYRDTGPLGP
jgi:hypothetical protein